MDMIKGKMDFDIQDFSERQERQMIFNILPDGRSLLHLLSVSKEDTANDQIAAIHATNDLFHVAHEVTESSITGAPDGCSLEIPILPDRYGNTALDYVLGIRETNQYSDIFDQISKVDNILQSENIAMAEAIFKGISGYGFMHSSFFVKDAVIKAARIGLDGLGEYLDGRMCNI